MLFLMNDFWICDLKTFVQFKNVFMLGKAGFAVEADFLTRPGQACILWQTSLAFAEVSFLGVNTQM